MLAKILGRQIGEELTDLKSTSVGLYPTLTSALDTAQPKSSRLKQTLQQTFTVWVTGQKPHQGRCNWRFIQTSKSKLSFESPHTPFPTERVLLRPYFCQHQAVPAPRCWLCHPPKPPSLRQLWRHIHTPFQGVGVRRLCYLEKESTSIPTDFTELGGKQRIW